MKRLVVLFSKKVNNSKRFQLVIELRVLVLIHGLRCLLLDLHTSILNLAFDWEIK